MLSTLSRKGKREGRWKEAGKKEGGERYVAFNVDCRVESEGLSKVTGSDIHCISGDSLKTMQHCYCQPPIGSGAIESGHLR